VINVEGGSKSNPLGLSPGGERTQNTLIEKLNTPIEKTNTPAKDNSIEKTLSIEEFVSVWNSVKSI
jgi:hypothetical protein